MKSSKVQTDKEEAEWAELKKINDGWNRQTAVLRYFISTTTFLSGVGVHRGLEV